MEQAAQRRAYSLSRTLYSQASQGQAGTEPPECKIPLPMTEGLAKWSLNVQSKSLCDFLQKTFIVYLIPSQITFLPLVLYKQPHALKILQYLWFQFV